MEGIKDKEGSFNEARIVHKSLDKKLQTLEAKPYLTNEEELEVRILKKKKLHYKDIMEATKEGRR